MSFVSLEFTDGYLKHVNIKCVSVIYVKKVIVVFIEANAKCFQLNLKLNYIICFI